VFESGREHDLEVLAGKSPSLHCAETEKYARHLLFNGDAGR
jgi:hypothetical protein